MLKHNPKYFADKTWWYQKKMAAQQNQNNPGTGNCIWLQQMMICLHFYIIHSSIWDHCPFRSTAKHYVEVVKKWALGYFLQYGMLSSTKKGTKKAHQPNLAVLGWVLLLQMCLDWLVLMHIEQKKICPLDGQAQTTSSINMSNKFTTK